MKNGARVLVVDDEQQILRALRTSLRGAGYEVETADSVETALAAAAMRPPEAVILDLVLPDGTGTDLCRELRSWSSAPVIVLSAVGEEREKVAALDAGADDYVTKPVGIDELLARLRAVLRRTAPSGEPVITIGELLIDLQKRLVSMAGESVHLTPHQFDLLRVFAVNQGKLAGELLKLGRERRNAAGDDAEPAPPRLGDQAPQRPRQPRSRPPAREAAAVTANGSDQVRITVERKPLDQQIPPGGGDMSERKRERGDRERQRSPRPEQHGQRTSDKRQRRIGALLPTPQLKLTAKRTQPIGRPSSRCSQRTSAMRDTVSHLVGTATWAWRAPDGDGVARPDAQPGRRGASFPDVLGDG